METSASSATIGAPFKTIAAKKTFAREAATDILRELLLFDRNQTVFVWRDAVDGGFRWATSAMPNDVTEPALFATCLDDRATRSVGSLTNALLAGAIEIKAAELGREVGS